VKFFFIKIKKILFAKWIFLKPANKDILIYDASSIEIFYLIFNKKDCECLHVRYESINFYIIITALFKYGIRNFKDNYKLCFLKAVSPKVVFTLIDNNPAFYKLKYIYSKAIYVSIQISARNNVFFDLCENYYLNNKNKKLRADYIFVIGKNDIERFSKIIESKIDCLGSVKNNYFYIKKNQQKLKEINSILFISTKNKLTNFIKEEKIVFNELYKFCEKSNYKLSICTKNDSEHEKIYRKNLIKGSWNYLSYINMENTYNLINNSQLVVFTNSTLGVEALTKKIRGAAFPTKLFPLKGYAKKYPEVGPFWSCNFNSKSMEDNLSKSLEDILQKVIKYTNSEWEKIIEEYIADMVEYDERNSKLIKLAQNYNLPLKNSLFS